MSITEFYQNRDIIANIDLDGFVSAAILHKVFGSDINGFTNSRDTVFYLKNCETSSKDCVWVDFHIAKKGYYSHDQHINYYNIDDLLANNNEYSLNANLDRGVSYENGYCNKFPFSTSMDILFRLDVDGIRLDVDLFKPVNSDGTILLMDLILHTDSSFGNILKYRNNVLNWFEYELKITNNGYYTRLMYDYINSLVDKGIDKSEIIKKYLNEKYETNTKSGDGYVTGTETKRMMDFLNGIYDLFGIEFNHKLSDYIIYHYQFGFAKVDTLEDFKNVISKHDMLSYSFVFAKSSTKQQLSYTYI